MYWELLYLLKPYVHLALSLASLFLGDNPLLPEAMESQQSPQVQDL